MWFFELLLVDAYNVAPLVDADNVAPLVDAYNVAPLVDADNMQGMLIPVRSCKPSLSK